MLQLRTFFLLVMLIMTPHSLAVPVPRGGGGRSGGNAPKSAKPKHADDGPITAPPEICMQDWTGQEVTQEMINKEHEESAGTFLMSSRMVAQKKEWERRCGPDPKPLIDVPEKSPYPMPLSGPGMSDGGLGMGIVAIVNGVDEAVHTGDREKAADERRAYQIRVAEEDRQKILAQEKASADSMAAKQHRQELYAKQREASKGYFTPEMAKAARERAFADAKAAREREAKLYTHKNLRILMKGGKVPGLNVSKKVLETLRAIEALEKKKGHAKKPSSAKKVSKTATRKKASQRSSSKSSGRNRKSALAKSRKGRKKTHLGKSHAKSHASKGKSSKVPTRRRAKKAGSTSRRLSHTKAHKKSARKSVPRKMRPSSKKASQRRPRKPSKKKPTSHPPSSKPSRAPQIKPDIADIEAEGRLVGASLKANALRGGKILS